MTLGLKSFWLVVLFTAVETVVLVLWLIFALQGKTLLSVAFLFFGLFLEHVIAAHAGKKEGQGQ